MLLPEALRVNDSPALSRDYTANRQSHRLD